MQKDSQGEGLTLSNVYCRSYIQQGDAYKPNHGYKEHNVGTRLFRLNKKALLHCG